MSTWLGVKAVDVATVVTFHGAVPLRINISLACSDTQALQFSAAMAWATTVTDSCGKQSCTLLTLNGTAYKTGSEGKGTIDAVVSSAQRHTKDLQVYNV